MEFKDLLFYIREFGITPVFFTMVIIIIWKNKERIFEVIAEQISCYLVDDQSKLIKQKDNDLLIKEIQILELYLLNQTHQYFSVIMDLYDKHKEKFPESMEEFQKGITDYFQTSLGLKMAPYQIRSEIAHYFQDEVRGPSVSCFLTRLFEAISMNGNSNSQIFKTLLHDLLDNFVARVVDQIEKNFLFSKL